MIWLTDRVDLLTAELDEMLDGGGLLARPPAVGAVFPFARLPDALELLNSFPQSSVVKLRPPSAAPVPLQDRTSF